MFLCLTTYPRLHSFSFPLKNTEGFQDKDYERKYLLLASENGGKTWKTKKENALIFSCVSKGFICCVLIVFCLVLLWFFSPKHLVVCCQISKSQTLLRYYSMVFSITVRQTSLQHTHTLSTYFFNLRKK